MLPYFKRAETRASGDPSVRGTSGPLQVTDPREQHPLCNAFFAAMENLGQRANPDYNTGDQEGYGHYQYLMRDGRRWSAADAYLRPALKRTNVSLWAKAHVTGIVCENGRATGVELQHGGERKVVKPRREVLLAAGAINSPQLLQLSGIGDPHLLARFGIPVVVAAPAVGNNLVDHYAVRMAAHATLASRRRWRTSRGRSGPGGRRSPVSG